MNHNIQRYTAFIKTVECGSFTKAAEFLSYSQSSISKMIASLENEWGVTLLVRNRGGVIPTADGLALLPHIKRLLADYDRIHICIDDLKNIISGTIRIGTFSSVATHWLPNVIREFRKDYPGIEFEFLVGDYGEIEQWLIEGRIDCGFLRLPTLPELEITKLEKDELLVILPADHPLTQKELIDPEDLDHEPFLLLGHGDKTEVTWLLNKYDVHPDIRLATWDDYAIMSMVESGLGIGILPKLILKRTPYNIELRSLSVPAYREIVVAVKDQHALSNAVQRFMQYLGYRNTPPLSES